jgi:endonuclease/exonuclease/phosphatase family metal-dependent hydrolase
MRRLFKILVWTAVIFLLYVAGFLLFGTVTDWKPKGTETLSSSVASAERAQPVIQDSIISLLSWNVGYGGIGDKDFFFYNKGDFFWTTPGTVRMSEERIMSNVDGQELTVKNTLSDFFLLQEIDTAAYRSRYVNQLQTVREARPSYATFFAPNFKSKRVPLPLLQPWDHYGYVVGGLVSMSKYRPATAERIQLPGEFPWPTKLFQLDRCALRQVYPVKEGQELAVYNVHLSAYDKDGSIRRQQMNALREAALADYEAGRYVIIGGDWNQMPPGFNWFSLNPTVERVELPTAVSFDFMPPGWKYGYDPGTATVRESHIPYDAHRSRRSVIDFFLLSPNLRIKRVKGLDQAFKYSDHQPVYLEVEMMK